MVFYRSFYDAIKDLPDEQLVSSFKAIMEYGLDGKEPETNGLEKTIYLLTKPQIDANNKRYLNGTKGGRKKSEPEPEGKQDESDPEPDNNQEVTKSEPRLNQVLTETEPKEKDKVKEKEKDKKIENRAFAPPTVENVIGYCNEKGYKVDAERFVDFYSSKGWMIGKNKMKDWRAAVRNWARQEKEAEKPKVKKNAFSANCPQRDYNMDDLERQLLSS